MTELDGIVRSPAPPLSVSDGTWPKPSGNLLVANLGLEPQSELQPCALSCYFGGLWSSPSLPPILLITKSCWFYLIKVSRPVHFSSLPPSSPARTPMLTSYHISLLLVLPRSDPFFTLQPEWAFTDRGVSVSIPSLKPTELLGICSKFLICCSSLLRLP